ncbi:MAG: adenine deaminase C-terminal domain-containing protein [Frankia sp.]
MPGEPGDATVPVPRRPLSVGGGRQPPRPVDSPGLPADQGWFVGPLNPSARELARLRQVALGAVEADLAVRGAMVAVVHTGELLARDVLIVGRFIAAVTAHGLFPARRSLDASGLYVLPGYLDTALPVEHTLLTAGELARLVVPLGTTTVVATPSGAATALGRAGLELLTATKTPLRILPASVGGGPRRSFGPAAGFGGSTVDDLHGNVLDPMLDALLDPLAGRGARTVADLADDGHVDHDVRRGVAGGAPPGDARRRPTLSRARRARLEHVLGSVTPSHLADLQLVGEPGAAGPPELVIASGRIAAERGRPLFDNLDLVPDWANDTVRIGAGLSARSFAVPATGARAWVQAAEVVPVTADGRGGPAICRTRAFHADLPVRDGGVVADPSRDVLKIAIVDRHEASDAVGVGFVRGFGLARGALAATTNDENGNIVVVGANDDDMLTALRALEGMGGGFVAVDRGWVRAACPLSVAGIVSDGTWEAALENVRGVNTVAAELGCQLEAPFLTLAFTGRTDVGDLGLTERGLVDVAAGGLAPVVLGLEGGRPTCRCPSHGAEVHRIFDGAAR